MVRPNDTPDLDVYSTYDGGFDLHAASFAYGVRPKDDAWQIREKSSGNGWVNLFHVERNGNIGIGTASPSYNLDVSGDINFTGEIYKDGVPLSFGQGLWTQNGDDIHYSTGKVGIGVDTPAKALDVAGDIQMSGAVHKGNERFLASVNENTFLGIKTGQANTSGARNTYVGRNAGRANTTGYNNTFSGYAVGQANTSGYYNTFYGYEAGLENTTGYENTFAGGHAGMHNTTGNFNTFLGC